MIPLRSPQDQLQEDYKAFTSCLFLSCTTKSQINGVISTALGCIFMIAPKKGSVYRVSGWFLFNTSLTNAVWKLRSSDFFKEKLKLLVYYSLYVDLITLPPMKYGDMSGRKQMCIHFFILFVFRRCCSGGLPCFGRSQDTLIITLHIFLKIEGRCLHSYELACLRGIYRGGEKRNTVPREVWLVTAYKGGVGSVTQLLRAFRIVSIALMCETAAFDSAVCVCLCVCVCVCMCMCVCMHVCVCVYIKIFYSSTLSSFELRVGRFQVTFQWNTHTCPAWLSTKTEAYVQEGNTQHVFIFTTFCSQAARDSECKYMKTLLRA